MDKKELKNQFESIGIKKGDILAVHSSLSSLGYVEGGAETVIMALQEIITEEGLILMPTHTGNISGKNKEGYHPKKTHCKNIVGTIPDTFWQMKGVKRSMHPTHSAAARGKKADKILEHHSPYTYAFEKNTPFHKVALLNGKILLLGVDNTKNSSIHVAEYLADAPYLEASYSFPEDAGFLIEKNNYTIKIPKTRFTPGCSKNFQIFDPILLKNNVMKKCSIGNSTSYIIESSNMMEVLAPYFNNNPEMVLCNQSNCSCCNNRRILLKQKGLL